MKTALSRKNVKSPFVAKVAELSGQNLLACYQCGKCSAGCPVVSQMDILPNQIIRFAQLGLQEDLLESRAIWVCASCMTCNVRCPKGINIAEVKWAKLKAGMTADEVSDLLGKPRARSTARGEVRQV